MISTVRSGSAATTSGSVSAAAAEVGTAVTVAGNATGCPSPRYAFYILPPGGHWYLAQAYSSNPNLAWATLGRAGASGSGVARALLEVEADGFRTPLRQAGLLTRDPRMKERKKYGLKRARKAPQYTKR